MFSNQRRRYEVIESDKPPMSYLSTNSDSQYSHCSLHLLQVKSLVTEKTFLDLLHKSKSYQNKRVLYTL